MNTRIIPFHFFDTSTYGTYFSRERMGDYPRNAYLQGFLDWLNKAKKDCIEILLIPKPLDLHEEYSIGLGSSDIQYIVQTYGFIFMSEKKWEKRQQKQKQPSRLPNAFERLVAEEGTLHLQQ